MVTNDEHQDDWSFLKVHARAAGMTVNDDGSSVEFRAPGRQNIVGVFFKETNPRAKETGYSAAMDWLKYHGVLFTGLQIVEE